MWRVLQRSSRRPLKGERVRNRKGKTIKVNKSVVVLECGGDVRVRTQCMDDLKGE